MSLDDAVKIVTLLLAGVAALISWLNFRKSGSQRIAQFRKEWIENLRVHFAEFESTWYIIRVLNAQLKIAIDDAIGTKLREEKQAKYERIAYLRRYILLMLNPEEDLHQQMEDRMKAMMSKLTEAQKNENEPNQAENELPKFSVLSRKILKAEWQKLKTET